MESGFEPAGVLSFGVFPSRSDYPTTPQILRFHRELLAGVRSVPGVDGAGAISILPLGEGMWRATFVPEGSEGLPAEEQPLANARQVSPGYFRTMRIPLLQGRELAWTDDESSPVVVVVNRSLAEAAFGRIDVVGRSIGWENRRWEIVGVVEDVHQHGLVSPPGPEINASLAQYVRHPMRFVVRTDGDPIALLPRVDEVLRRLDPGVPLADVATMQRRIATTIAPARFRAFLTIALATLALLIATVGIYSALVSNLSRQVREIGVRIALGAAPDTLRIAVLGSILALVLAGCVVGMAGGALIVRVLDAWLFQVDPLDPLLFGAVTVVMLAFAVAATFGPAHRASRLDPMAALRTE